ncbi:hypothetical protein CBM2585_B50096 [Cupriavidus taiwanensis]|nr:hypothetical protein CBM2585_B50096 [Cupriavidus taiwanensis]
MSIQYKHELMPVLLEKESGTPLWHEADDFNLDAPF